MTTKKELAFWLRGEAHDAYDHDDETFVPSVLALAERLEREDDDPACDRCGTVDESRVVLTLCCYCMPEPVQRGDAPSPPARPLVREGRCAVCDWPLKATIDEGCTAESCSYRPEQGSDEWHRIQERRKALAELAEPKCTGITAFWCPVCGDCKCPREHDGECYFENLRCPLHGSESTHAAAEVRAFAETDLYKALSKVTKKKKAPEPTVHTPAGDVCPLCGAPVTARPSMARPNAEALLAHGDCQSASGATWVLA